MSGGDGGSWLWTVILGMLLLSSVGSCGGFDGFIVLGALIAIVLIGFWGITFTFFK